MSTGTSLVSKTMKAGFAGYAFAVVAAAGVAATATAQEDPGRGDVAFGSAPMVRGTVTATAPNQLTIKTDAGETYEVVFSPNTRIMKDQRRPGETGKGRQPGDRQAIKAEDIKAGDGVGAMGELDAPKKTIHALFVAVMDAEDVKKLREGLGKVYIAGKITAIDDVKLTVLRPDNVSQVIEVDETTSFRKGGRRAFISPDGVSPMPSAGGGAAGASASGESVTLADVKVGDMIAAQGSVKHGIFVPTNLTVMPPGAMGPRMRREGEGTPQGSASTPRQ